MEVTYTMYTEMTVTGGMFLVNGDTSSKASCQQSCTDNADCTHIAYGPASGPNCYLYKGGVISGQTVPTGEGYIGYVQARNGIDREYHLWFVGDAQHQAITPLPNTTTVTILTYRPLIGSQWTTSVAPFANMIYI